MTNREALPTNQINPKKENKMPENRKMPNPNEMRCAYCGIRRRAEAKPDLFFSRVWKWHTGWCPGWKAYQEALAETRGEAVRIMPNI
jgi:hypothetical protein